MSATTKPPTWKKACALLTGMLALVLALAAPSHAGEPTVTLPIPDRPHAVEAPEAGWCGESAIQQILLYYGAWYPQAEVNRLGKPRHADLYASDLPVALRAVGLRYKRAPRTRGTEALFAWIRTQLDEGRPVLAGVKIHPTAHPNWSLDHFVVIVGYDSDRFLLNTTWGDQRWRSTRDLSSFAEGLSFANKHGSYYAMAVSRPGSSAQVRILREADRLKVEVVCSGLEVGERYELVRRTGKTVDTSRFRAKSADYRKRVTVGADRPAVFACRPWTGPDGGPTD